MEVAGHSVVEVEELVDVGQVNLVKDDLIVQSPCQLLLKDLEKPTPRGKSIQQDVKLQPLGK